MKPLKLFNALFVALLFSILLSMLTGGSPVMFFAVMLMLSFIPMPKGVLRMGLNVEIWKNDIIGNLYKDNAFALRSFNADQFVLAGQVVHSPIAGSNAQVKKNLTSFPQVAVNRADSFHTYAIDTFYSLPRQIQKIEEYELSYDKRQSVMGDDQAALREAAMENLLLKWAPGAPNVVETTGSATAEDLIDTTATGSRKVFTKAEFKKIAKKVANTNIAGRKTALLTANHYHQFFESLSDAEKTNFNNVANLSTGVIGQYMGWDVIMRSSVLRYRKVAGIWTAIDTLAEDFAAGTEDSAASLFWVDNCVERALGEVNVFEDNSNPLYYGDVFSQMLRLGGRKRRDAGVHAVVEAIV